MLHSQPRSSKKRRLLFRYKEASRNKKRESRVERRIPHEERTSLSSVALGAKIIGQVISLVPFGCYVDIGCEKDALLHVRDMKQDEFVSHPREVVSAGEDVEVYVKVRRWEGAAKRRDGQRQVVSYNIDITLSMTRYARCSILRRGRWG